MSQTLSEQEMTSWEEVEKRLDNNRSYTVEEVTGMLSVNDKGKVNQGIDNCMVALMYDPILSGAICHNDLTGKTDIIKNLGWDKPTGGGIRDGISRIGDLLPKYLGVEKSEYETEIMTLLMQAAIHRIYDPGCKYEIMVCLIGGQGAGKSTLFRLLAIKDEWFSDDLRRLDDDNVYRKLQGHWIIEMPEMLATVNARTVEEIKSFLSKQKDNYKIPYEVHPEDRPRQCVFVGTSNTLDFLPLDRTGNRRFAPITVHLEKVEKHILEDEQESRKYINQVWAEMMDYYRKNKRFKLKLSGKTAEYLKELQKEHMPEDTNVGIIQAWLDNYKDDYVCSRMIYRDALGRDSDNPKQWELQEIGNIMNNSIEGWEKGPQHRFADYGQQRCWKRTKPKGEFLPVPDDVELPFK